MGFWLLAGLAAGVLSGMAVGAVSGAAGNLTQQILSVDSCSSINYNQVGKSASIGALVGVIGGVTTIGTIAMQNSNMALKGFMASQLNTVESALPVASMETIHGVQNAIVKGAASLGGTTASTTLAINTAETFGLTAIEQGLQ